MAVFGDRWLIPSRVSTHLAYFPAVVILKKTYKIDPNEDNWTRFIQSSYYLEMSCGCHGPLNWRGKCSQSVSSSERIQKESDWKEKGHHWLRHRVEALPLLVLSMIFKYVQAPYLTKIACFSRDLYWSVVSRIGDRKGGIGPNNDQTIFYATPHDTDRKE